VHDTGCTEAMATVEVSKGSGGIRRCQKQVVLRRTVGENKNKKTVVPAQRTLGLTTGRWKEVQQYSNRWFGAFHCATSPSEC
jgi:hypothetical protein